MNRKIFAAFAITALFLLITPLLLVRIVRAADTDSVAATVTAQIFSVSVADGSVAFGTVAQSSTKDTTTNGTTGVDDSQTATNDGSVAAKFNIMAADSTGGAGWTLGSSADSETYTMKFCTTDCDGSPSWSSVGIDPSYATLAASVDASSGQTFDLQVGTPTSTTETTQQSITVTVQAVAP